jgi:hypothetical protein
MRLADDLTSATDSGFSWSGFGTGLLDLAKTAATAAASYKVAQYTAQSQQAAQQAAQQRASAGLPGMPLIPPTGSMQFQYPQNPAYSGIYGGQPTPTSMMPVLLIAGVGIVAAFLIMGRK